MTICRKRGKCPTAQTQSVRARDYAAFENKLQKGASMTVVQASATVFSEEANDTLSALSAAFCAGLNGSGPVNRFHHVKGRDLVWTEGGLRDFFRYADPGIREATGNRLDIHLVRANEAPERG